jgi:hypothetical protein
VLKVLGSHPAAQGGFHDNMCTPSQESLTQGYTSIRKQREPPHCEGQPKLRDILGGKSPLNIGSSLTCAPTTQRSPLNPRASLTLSTSALTPVPLLALTQNT